MSAMLLKTALPDELVDDFFVVVSLLKTALVDELVAEKVVENLLSMSSMSSMSSTNCSSMRVNFFVVPMLLMTMICY